MKPRIVYETHMHTPLCKHAEGAVGEYAAVAEARGLRGITVTCHNPMPDSYSEDTRMSLGQFPEYLRLVREAAEEWEGRVEVLLGMESDFVPGYEAWLRELHSSQPFHHILGSVHPHVKDYRDRYDTGDAVGFFRLYFEHLAQAAETGLFDTIAHPDIVKNIRPEFWDLEVLMPSIQAALDRIAKTGCAMEINTSGLLKTVPEMNPSSVILREMKERGIPVVVGADAHIPGRVADHYEEAYDLLEEAGYERVSFFYERKRRELPIAEARGSLNRKSNP